MAYVESGYWISGYAEGDTSGGATLGGAVNLEGAASAGNIASNTSALGGGISLDEMFASGSMGSASGTLITDEFRNAANTLLASTTIPKVTVLRVSDMVVLVNLTNQVTDGSGVLTITNAALTAGTQCLVVTCNADGTAFGCQPYTVA